jgi:hypothetical protein
MNIYYLPLVKKIPCPFTDMESLKAVLDGAVYLACSDASCAYVGFSYFAVIFDSDSLDIRIPFSLSMSV